MEHNEKETMQTINEYDWYNLKTKNKSKAVTMPDFKVPDLGSNKNRTEWIEEQRT
jgi:hypothetical protein